VRVAAIALIAGAIVALWPRHGGSPNGTGQPPAQGAPSGVTLSVPDIRITSAGFAGGGQFVLSENAQRPTVLYGMAAWCGSCIQQAKSLVALKRQLGDRFNLVVVDIDPNDTDGNLRGFAHTAGGGLGVWAIDRDGSIVRPYHIAYLHTTILIRDGREISRSLDDQSLDQLRAAVTGD
jgi:hypothetical protein